MYRVRIPLALLALSLPAAPAAAAPSDTAPADAQERPQFRIDERGVRVPIPANIPDNHVSKILFLNRCEGGCLLEPGNNDARFNTSTIVSGTSQVSEFAHGDEVWDQVVQCVKEIYAPYDVEVTDVDPGEEIFHHEAIVAGDYDEIGYDTPVGGVAPSICTPANNVISFTFANGYGPNPIQICEVVGQESAHSYGLEHAFDCSDPMTYLGPCGRKFFRDRTTPCGEYEAEDQCFCGGSAQNSHRWLRMVLGENSEPIPAPELSILQPSDGEEVTDEFFIAADASHMRGIGKVSLFLNGTEYGTLEGYDYSEADRAYRFNAPAELPDGIIDVEIRAENDIGSETVEMITVQKGEPCGSADECLSGQECDEGRCYWPPPAGELGDPCTSAQQCISGLCPSSGEERYCSETCSPADQTTCPGGFRCVETSINQGVCWPQTSGGCGCAASGPEGAAGLLALFFLAFGLLAPRRRRSPGRAL